MLERRCLGANSSKPHSHMQINNQDSFEFVFTRDGFAGGYSIAHLVHAPTAVEKAQPFEANTGFLPTEPSEKPLLNRMHIQGHALGIGTNFWQSRKCTFYNSSTNISILRGNMQMENTKTCFTNGDADELYFILEGEGSLLTPFGLNTFNKNDYILIPKGTPYQFVSSKNIHGLCISGSPFIEIPAEFKNPHGQLKLEAPYAHRSFKAPTRLLSDQEASCFENIITLKGGQLTQHKYRTNPYLVRGWDGSIYPISFNILDYLPKTGKYHLPPNLHLTFKASDFVICSFVPRMLDYGEGAIPCPYPHSNPSCEELLYYVSGDFTSRAGIKAESMSYHPMGIPHGPQPGKYHGSMKAKETNEVAVMVDTWKELKMTQVAMALRDPDYETSWTL